MVAAMLAGGDDDRNPLPPSGGIVHNFVPYYPDDALAIELIGRDAFGTPTVHRRLDVLDDAFSPTSQPPECFIFPKSPTNPEACAHVMHEGFIHEMGALVEYNEPTIEFGLSGLSDLPSLLERGTGLGYEIGFQFKRLSDKEGTILAILDTSRPTGHPGGPGISAGSWPESEFGNRVWYDYTFETPAAVVFRQTEYGYGGTIYAMFPTRDQSFIVLSIVKFVLRSVVCMRGLCRGGFSKTSLDRRKRSVFFFTDHTARPGWSPRSGSRITGVTKRG